MVILLSHEIQNYILRLPPLDRVQKLVVVHIRISGGSATRDWKRSPCLWLQASWHPKTSFLFRLLWEQKLGFRP